MAVIHIWQHCEGTTCASVFMNLGKMALKTTKAFQNKTKLDIKQTCFEQIINTIFLFLHILSILNCPLQFKTK